MMPANAYSLSIGGRVMKLFHSVLGAYRRILRIRGAGHFKVLALPLSTDNFHFTFEENQPFVTVFIAIESETLLIIILYPFASVELPAAAQC